MNLPVLQGGVLLSVGIDLVDVARVRGVHERNGQAFLDRVFTAEEQAYCMKMRNPYPHLAARFAVKEAASKAFSTGIGEYFGWMSVSVSKGEREEPLAVLDTQAQALLKQVGGTRLLISLTHTDTLAQAVACIVGE